MKAARLSSSSRLQRVLKVLKDRKSHSTMNIIKQANVCAVNSIVSELRHNGVAIQCSRKGDKWFYKIAA